MAQRKVPKRKQRTEITSRDLRPRALIHERGVTIYIYLLVCGVRRAFDEDLGLYGLWLDL